MNGIEEGGRGMYTPVYDVSTIHAPYIILAAAFLFAALGIVLLLMQHRLVGIVFCFFAVVVGCGFISQTYTLLHARSLLREGRVEVIEGVVHAFTPMPEDGHAIESFCVGGTCFHYGHTTLTAGLDHGKARTAGIRNGVQAKVFHVGNEIVRLEVRRQ